MDAVKALRFGRFELQPRQRRVLRDGEPIPVGSRAFDVLLALAERRDRIVGKAELMDLVWPGLVVEENNLEVQVSSLRRLLGPNVIATVPGRGYRFTAELAAGDEEGSVPVDEAGSSRSIRSGGTSRPTGAGRDDAAVGAALIGRDALLAELCEMAMRDEARLVTLTGPGGSGKTRLALAATRALSPRVPDGVHVVLLAPVRDARHLMAAIAATLGLQEGGAESLEALVHGYLRHRRAMLLLDNLEHLPDAVPQIAALLDACPHVRVLATSRMLLHLHNEHELKVPPLALPVTDDADGLAASPAVALFAARAASLGLDILASTDDLRAAARICRRLDGLPLAIELACARLRVLAPRDLADRLQQSLPLLKGGAANVPDRQRTLRDTIAWSHDLLDMPARALFHRVGVFAGGWSLEAAEVLAEDGGGGVIDALDLLLDHNLVQRVPDIAGQSRYAMLETIREFALEQLAAAGDLALARDRHADFFVARAAADTPHLTTADRGPWLLRLRAETNNFRIALDWLLRERHEVGAGMALAASLTWLWYFEGLYREGCGWMREALALPGANRASTEAAAAVSGMARLTAFIGDMGEAHRLGADAITRWRVLSDRRGLAFALFYQGVPAMFCVGADQGATHLREARQCFSDLDDDWGVAMCIVYEGVVRAFYPGAENEALVLLDEGLARCRALGDEWAASTCSAYVGTVAMRRGDTATARRSFEHILGQARQTGDRFRIARTAYLMAELELIEGRDAHALAYFAESLGLAREQGRSGEIPQLLRAIGRALVGLSRHGEAASLLAAGARDGGARSTLPPEDRAAVAAATARCRRTLGEDAFDRVWQRDAVLPLERAVEAGLAAARAGAPAVSAAAS
jgi:non-specific serine/threonine protein kinase